MTLQQNDFSTSVSNILGNIQNRLDVMLRVGEVVDFDHQTRACTVELQDGGRIENVLVAPVAWGRIANWFVEPNERSEMPVYPQGRGAPRAIYRNGSFVLLATPRGNARARSFIVSGLPAKQEQLPPIAFTRRGALDADNLPELRLPIDYLRQVYGRDMTTNLIGTRPQGSEFKVGRQKSAEDSVTRSKSAEAFELLQQATGSISVANGTDVLDSEGNLTPEGAAATSLLNDYQRLQSSEVQISSYAAVIQDVPRRFDSVYSKVRFIDGERTSVSLYDVTEPSSGNGTGAPTKLIGTHRIQGYDFTATLITDDPLFDYYVGIQLPPFLNPYVASDFLFATPLLTGYGPLIINSNAPPASRFFYDLEYNAAAFTYRFFLDSPTYHQRKETPDTDPIYNALRSTKWGKERYDDTFTQGQWFIAQRKHQRVFSTYNGKAITQGTLNDLGVVSISAIDQMDNDIGTGDIQITRSGQGMQDITITWSVPNAECGACAQYAPVLNGNAIIPIRQDPATEVHISYYLVGMDTGTSWAEPTGDDADTAFHPIAIKPIAYVPYDGEDGLEQPQYTERGSYTFRLPNTPPAVDVNEGVTVRVLFTDPQGHVKAGKVVKI